MTIAGSPDWQRQAVGTATPIATIAVNTAGAQTTDITALLLPYHCALQLFWAASAGGGGGPVLVEVVTGSGVITPLDFTQIQDGGAVVTPLAARVITDNAAETLLVTAGPVVGGPSPVVGTLLVYAYSVPPLVVVTRRLNFEGLGFSSGSVSVLAGATTPVLPVPPTGTYWRVKYMSYHFLAAPVASSRAQFQGTGSGTAITFNRFQALADAGLDVPVDFQWNDGISLQNNTAQTAAAVIVAELWPA